TACWLGHLFNPPPNYGRTIINESPTPTAISLPPPPNRSIRAARARIECRCFLIRIVLMKLIISVVCEAKIASLAV
ncbi:MAG: hypothetical protein LUC86_08490, partial [Prevotellaceae bacterium]|nr:hypothetical protein [Prevotellaceae bacterium]